MPGELGHLLVEGEGEGVEEGVQTPHLHLLNNIKHTMTYN